MTAANTNEKGLKRVVTRRKVVTSAAVGGLGLAALGVGAACGDDDENATAAGGGAAGAGAAARVPVTQKFTIQLGEGKIVADVAGKAQIVGDLHRWEPPVLIAFKGDKITLEVKNPRKHIHSLVIPAFKVDTGTLEPRTGTKTVEFTVDQAGVFPMNCGVGFDEGKLECDPDHAQMVAHFIVLNV